MIINTPRLQLRCWKETDRDVFAALHADPEVMHDYGGPISRNESYAKLDRYCAAYLDHGLSRWAVEDVDGNFIGYAGVMPRLSPGHSLGSHFEVGWRFMRAAWGHGYATESAKAALDDAFIRLELKEIFSYTSVDNLRSQAVMARLRLRRDPLYDFTLDFDSIKAWQGLVWRFP